MSFDFWGTDLEINPEQSLHIYIGDGRNMQVTFETTEAGTKVTEYFEPENKNPEDLQKEGWQMILDNFKSYAESATS